MGFAGINHLAVLVAAVAAWLVGAIWYTALSRPWIAAQGKTEAEVKAGFAHLKGAAVVMPYVLSFVVDFVMAWMMAGLLGHIGALSVRGGLISAGFVWFGFLVLPILVNNMFQRRSLWLTAIDGGHWLAVLLVIGAVLGAWGV